MDLFLLASCDFFVGTMSRWVSSRVPAIAFFIDISSAEQDMTFTQPSRVGKVGKKASS